MPFPANFYHVELDPIAISCRIVLNTVYYPYSLQILIQFRCTRFVLKAKFSRFFTICMYCMQLCSRPITSLHSMHNRTRWFFGILMKCKMHFISPGCVQSEPYVAQVCIIYMIHFRICMYCRTLSGWNKSFLYCEHYKSIIFSTICINCRSKAALQVVIASTQYIFLNPAFRNDIL